MQAIPAAITLIPLLFVQAGFALASRIVLHCGMASATIAPAVAETTDTSQHKRNAIT